MTTSSGAAPVWLVLDRGIVATRPRGCSARWVTSRAASSLRRSAVTNPTSSRARSRSPARSGSGSPVAAPGVGARGAGGRASVQDVVEQRRQQRQGPPRRAGVGAPDPLPDGQDAGAGGGVGHVVHGVGEGDR
nr:hypothetical protein [Mycobacteroides abscessus]